MINAGVIQAVLRLKDINFQAGLAKAQTGAAKLSARLKTMGKNLSSAGRRMRTMFTLPILAAAAASLTLSAKFETAMTKIVTLVGIPTETVKEMGKQVKELSRNIGVSAEEAAEGLFFITSAGLRGADAMGALESSMKASALGLGDVATIADATTSAMNAYGIANLSAERATNIMALAIREGKLEASQLAPVLGRLLPTASAMGVEFEQVAGILAVMSRTGLDAAEASTSLSSIMTTLLKPTTQAKKALDSVGLSHAKLRKTAAGKGGLIEVMGQLNKAFEDDDEALVRVVPNVRAFRGVMNVLAQDADIVKGVMEGVAAEIDVLSEGMAELEETTGHKTKLAFNALKLEMLDMGDAMVPMWEAIIEKVAAFTEWVREMHPATKRMAGQLLKILAIGGPLLMAFGGLSTAISGIIGLFLTLGGPASVLLVVAGAFGFLAADVALANAKLEEHSKRIERSIEVQEAFKLAARPVLQIFHDFNESIEAQTPSLKALARAYVFAGKDLDDLLKGTQAYINDGLLFRDSGLQMIEVLREFGAEAQEAYKEANELAAQQAAAAKMARQHKEDMDDLIAAFDNGVPSAIDMKNAIKELNEEYKDINISIVEVSSSFDVGLPVSGPPVINAVNGVTAAMKNLNIVMPDVSFEMGELRRLSAALSPELEGLGVTSEVVAAQAQKLYDQWDALGVLTPELREELTALGATTDELGESTRISSEMWDTFFSTIRTGITWLDTLIEGVFRLIESLASGGGLTESLGAAGQIISGFFGGKDSKTGQIVGGIVSKLPSFFDMFKSAGAATGGTGGGIGGWLTKALGGLFGAGGAAAAGGTAAAGTGLGLTSAAVSGAGFALPAGFLTMGGGAAAGTGTALAGGGAALGGGLSLSSLASFATGPWGIAIMSGLLLWKTGALAKMGDMAKALLGGPSAAEIEARKIKGSLLPIMNELLAGQAAIEAGGVAWKVGNIAIRDSFTALGKSQAEIERAQNSLHDLQKKSPEEAKKVTDALKMIFTSVSNKMQETGMTLEELKAKAVNASIVAAQESTKAITETAKKATEAATVVATLATEETAKAAAKAAEATAVGIGSTLSSVVSACGGMKKVAKESAQEINESFTRSLKSVKDVASDTATKVKEAFDLNLTGPIDRLEERMARGLPALAATGGDGGGGDGARWEDQNSERLASLMSALPGLMERAVKTGMQSSGRKSKQ